MATDIHEQSKRGCILLTDIFIDFDDTIYDTHGNAVLALHELYEEFGLARYFDTYGVFSDLYWEANRRLWAQYARGEIERDDLIVRRFMEPLSQGRNYRPSVDEVLRISDFFLDSCSVKPGLVEGARELLDTLSGSFRLHMASNGFHEVQYRKMKSAGVDHYFDTVILSEDAGANKPHRRFFDYAFRKTGLTPQSVIMIGDNIETDIAGARDAGIRQIYFNRHPSERPAFRPTYEVFSLSEIPAIVFAERECAAGCGKEAGRETSR